MSHNSHSPVVSLLMRDAKGGYRRATADQILEAARRAVDRKMRRGQAFKSPTDAKAYLRAKLAGFEHEVFAVLFLDNKHRLIEYSEMFHGSISEADVHPREIVKKALRVNAAAVILSHNHPSGSPEPSGPDRAVTQRIRQALDLVDVRTLDHMVVAGGEVTAFSERGLL